MIKLILSRSNTIVLLITIMGMLYLYPTHTVYSQNNKAIFIENKGQLIDDLGNVRTDVKYYTTLPGLNIYFTSHSFYYVQLQQDIPISNIAKSKHQIESHSDVQSVVFNRFTTQVRIENSLSNVEIIPKGQSTSYYNFYLPHCGDGLANVSHFEEITYQNIYPLIDLRFYTNGGKLKFEFIIHPGGKPNDILLSYSKETKLSLNADGALVLHTSLGNIIDDKPFTFYASDEKTSINTNYRLENNKVTFPVLRYDSSRIIIIDPAIQWSTYFGGIGDDQTSHITIDKENYNIIIGRTFSQTFPIINGEQKKLSGQSDVFIAKFNSDGLPLWSTYYGGSDYEMQEDFDHCDIATDNDKNIVSTFCTRSNDILCKNSFQHKKSSSGNGADVFIIKLYPDGKLNWATYCGGYDDDDPFGITCDNSNNIYLTGQTASDILPLPDVPTNIERLNKRNGNAKDAFIIKLQPNGIPLWTRFYGGNGIEFAKGIVTDKNTGIYVCGFTSSRDLPVTSNSPQPAFGGGDNDGFIFRINPFGDIVWSTYFGGNKSDYCSSVCIDSSSIRNPNIIVTGSTRSKNISNTFPIVTDTIVGDLDITLMSLASNSSFNWIRLIGGINLDEANSVCVDRDNHIIISGRTGSDVLTSAFPIKGAFQSKYGGYIDCFVMKFTNEGKLEFNSFFGGTGQDNSLDISSDSATNFVAVGFTTSKNFPIVSGQYPNPADFLAISDGFVTKICNMEIPSVLTSQSPKFCKGNTFEVEITQQTSVVYSDIEWLLIQYNNKTVIGKSNKCLLPLNLDSGSYKLVCNVKNSKQCPANTDTVYIYIYEPPTVVVKDLTICKGEQITIDSVRVNGIQPFLYKWENHVSLDNITIRNPVAKPDSTTTYSLTVTDKNGCSQNTSVTVRVLDLPKVTIQSNSPLEFCKGDSVVLDAGVGYDKYLWSNGATTQSIKVDTSGTFSVSVFYSSGCTATSPFVKTIVHDLPSPVISRTDDILTTQSFSKYQWMLDGVEITGSTDIEHIIVKAGKYSVRVTNQYGCTYTSLEFDATILGKSTISVGSANGFIGTTVSIPLTLTSSEKLDILKADNYTATISYNASLLRLTSTTNNVQFSNPTLNKNRAVSILIGTRSFTSGLLSDLSFAVTLGDSEQTVISIDDVKWNIAEISTKKQNGIFTLAGLCKKNGTRLFSDNGELQFHQVSPNPASELITAVFSLIEMGNTKLELFDYAGNLVSTMFDEYKTNGEYSLSFPTSFLSNGQYALRLQTPSQMISTMFIINR